MNPYMIPAKLVAKASSETVVQSMLRSCASHTIQSRILSGVLPQDRGVSSV